MDIFLLEDDETLNFTLCEMLAESGHNLTSAHDLKGAYNKLLTSNPDLILLDLVIGDSSSLDILNMIGYRHPNTTVIYITGSNRFISGELFGFSENISWVLRKPVNMSDLKALTEHVSHLRKSKELREQMRTSVLRA